MLVYIGCNCWFGVGVIVLFGIMIGDNVVVGVGSIVIKDLFDNVVVVGNFVYILWYINDYDCLYYFKDC